MSPLVGLLSFLVLLAGWPGPVIAALVVFSSRGWEKLAALVILGLLTVVPSMMFPPVNDDAFGFGAAAKGIYWISSLLGLLVGLVIRASRPGLVRIDAESQQPSSPAVLAKSPNIVFALFLAACLPGLALYFGWFGGRSGDSLVAALATIIVGLAVLSAGNGIRTRRWLGGAFGIFCLASIVLWSALSAYAHQTGQHAFESARTMANGAPYCLESRRRELSKPWDMTVLNMRIRPSGPFNLEYHAQLVVNRDGTLERYHWSHRYGAFHGNGKVFDTSQCLRKFGSDEKIERRKAR